MYFFVRRLLVTLPVLAGVLTLVFFLVHLVPGDPVDLMLGEQAKVADREQLRVSLGLDAPLSQQFVSYLLGTFKGDWGESLHYRRSVIGLIVERLPATLELMLASMLVALLLALPLGVLAALFHGSALDQWAGGLAVVGVAMPNFWLGPILILVFSIYFDWLPVNGRGNLSNLVLPAITLGTALAALLSRITRSSLLEVLDENYMRTAKAKGLTTRSLLIFHAFPNALIPILTVMGLQIGTLLSGAIITESIFDWPGLGGLLLQAIYARDYPLVQGCILIIALSYAGVNLLIDLLYGWIDPRVR